MDECIYKAYVNILKEELLPAMGCTEPISVAYAAAIAKNALNCTPERVEISVSGNILKNVKSVIVPNTGGLKGVKAAAAAGIVAGRADKKLQVLEEIGEKEIAEIKAFLDTAEFKVVQAKNGCVFDIGVKLYGGGTDAFVRIEGHHTNVVEITRGGEKVFCGGETTGECALTDRSVLSVRGIVEFIESVKLADIEEVISRQIEFNSAIAEEGLKNEYGANVGKTILKAFGKDVHNLARATAAAGSDARMNGCSLPVVIVSGSGNQGMTASLPVVVYAKNLKVSREKLLRAVALSDLITIHLKTGIGRLSAYCGAVSAGAGAGAGVCYLYGGGVDEISRTIVNALAVDSGVICDGAKSSCAAKIATAVDTGLLGMEMCRNGCGFAGGDGILDSGVEKTILNVGDIARNGMRETDEEIIRLMIKNV